MRTEAFSNAGGAISEDTNNNDVLQKSDKKSALEEANLTKSDNKNILNNNSCSSIDDEMQELYGSRSYGSSLGNSRPTMISGKYRQKEERRKLLKLSMNKLKRIDDPENSLCRSVLINNIVKRLQREAREEKSQKSHHHQSISQSRCFGITNDFIARQEENLRKSGPIFSNSLTASSTSSRPTTPTTTDQLLDITNIRDSLSKPFEKLNDDAADLVSSESIPMELDVPIIISKSSSSSVSVTTTTTITGGGQKRSCSSSMNEECDVLSQFYQFNAASCSSRILDDDEDEDINVVDVDTSVSFDLEHSVKRRRIGGGGADCCITAADRLRDNLVVAPALPAPSVSCSYFASPPIAVTGIEQEWPLMDGGGNVVGPSSSNNNNVCANSVQSNSFSCGHSSMLNEIVVYHNLIASLES